MTTVKLALLFTLLFGAYSYGQSYDRQSSAREAWASNLATEDSPLQFDAVGTASRTLRISTDNDGNANAVECGMLLDQIFSSEGIGFRRELLARKFTAVACGVLTRPIAVQRAVQGAIQPRNKPKCCSSGDQVALEMDS